MNLDTPALQAFLAISQTGSTHAAARALGLSQASVSRRISRLEGDLGVALFVRGGHQLRLSAAGSRLLPEAQAHINALQKALRDIRSATIEAKTTVTIGCLATLSLYVLPNILADFLKKEKDTSVRVLDLAPNEIESSVMDHAADFALTMTGVGTLDLTHEVLVQQPLVLVSAKKCSPAPKNTVKWSDLGTRHLIGIGPSSAIQRLLESERSKIAVHLEFKHQVQRITTAVEMVAAGVGVTIVPMSPELRCRADLTITPITNPVIYRKVGILRRAGQSLSPAAARLRRLIAARLRR